VKFGYIRVYEGIKDLDYQVDALLKHGIVKENIIKDSEYKSLDIILKSKELDVGDTLVTWKISRVVASNFDFIKSLNDFINKGVKFKSLSEPIFDTTNLVRHSDLLMKIIPLLINIQKISISENIIAGQELARKNGKIIGNPKGLSKKAKEKAKLCAIYFKENNFTVNEICKIVGISINSYYKYLKYEGIKLEAKNNNT
jgi:DNA invertase Pin-like site-specific DNA recombinase